MVPHMLHLQCHDVHKLECPDEVNRQNCLHLGFLNGRGRNRIDFQLIDSVRRNGHVIYRQSGNLLIHPRWIQWLNQMVVVIGVKSLNLGVYLPPDQHHQTRDVAA